MRFKELATPTMHLILHIADFKHILKALQSVHVQVVKLFREKVD